MPAAAANWITLGPGERYRVAPPYDAAANWPDLFRALPGLLDAPETQLLAEGRHRLHRLTLPLNLPGQPPPNVVVKTYGRQSALRDLIARRRALGTKATRAFDIALALQSAGVGTPAPVAVYEQWSPSGRLLRSHFISLYIPGLTDFRVELNRLLSAAPAECAPIIDLLQTVADAVAAFHRAGVIHRDLGNQNIALQPIPPESAPPGHAPFRVYFIDLNRAVRPPALTDAQRGADLARLDIPSDLRRVFFAMIHGGHSPSRDFTRAERSARAAFDRHTALRPFRHPIREARIRARERDLPRPPSGRELWIWDERSAQPVQAYVSRDRRRYLPASNVFRSAAAFLRHAAPVTAAARRLDALSFASPVPFRDTIGVALEWTTGDRYRPDPALARDHWQAQLAALAPLDDAAGSPLPVLIRLYAHRPLAATDATLAAASALHDAAPSRPIAFALLQDRPSVTAPDRWTAFLSHVLPAIAPYADAVEFTHALNRSKWGVWDYAEAARLLAPLPALLAPYPDLPVLLPFGIDFEPYAFLPLQTFLPRFPDRPPTAKPTPSAHLYVDRRGPPEATQHGRDLVRKLAYLRALAAAGPAARTAFADLPDTRLTLTEANWPLLGTDAWSPVSSPYETLGPRKHNPAVDPEAYAAYMIRYLLLAAASGHVRRTYWWRLAAHGFGILDAPPDRFPHLDFPSPARPAYRALLDLLRLTSSATFLRLDRSPDALTLHFDAPAPARPFTLTWNPASPDLPRQG